MQAMDASAIQRLGLSAHDTIIGALTQSERSLRGLNGAGVESLRSPAFEDSKTADSDLSVSAHHVPRITSGTTYTATAGFEQPACVLLLELAAFLPFEACEELLAVMSLASDHFE